MRGTKFFVAWEALFALVLLKFAGLAGWVAELNDYSKGFSHYAQRKRTVNRKGWL